MTPRPYISRYQLLLWEASKERYMEEYYGNAKRWGNRGMALGEEIADAKEKGEDTGDFAKDFVIAQLPSYEIRDESITVEMVNGKTTVPVLIKPDTMKADWTVVAEYKTGSEKAPWTQKMVDDDEQLLFYATGVHIEKKFIPKLELYYAPTEIILGDDGIERPTLTGEVIKFETSRTLVQILKMKARILKAWKEIDAAGNALIT